MALLDGGQADVDIAIGALPVIRQSAIAIVYVHRLLSIIRRSGSGAPVPTVAAHAAADEEVVQGYERSGQGVMIGHDGFGEDGQARVAVADL